MGAAASTIFLRVCSPFVIHLYRIEPSETDRSLLIIALRLFGCLLRPNGLKQSRYICDRSVPSASNRAEGRPEVRQMARNRQTHLKTPGLMFALGFGFTVWGQTQGPLGYSVATPRPISPAEGPTTPS